MRQICLNHAAVKYGKGSCTFCVITPDCNFTFQAETKEDVNHWVGAISTICNRLVLYSINSDPNIPFATARPRSAEFLGKDSSVCGFFLSLALFVFLLVFLGTWY